jgi:hypothetical protein
MTFQAGRSGNSAGRPPGVPDKRTAMRKLLEPHSEALITKAVQMALDGDMAAMRLVLERIVPAYKGEAQPVALDALRNADGLTAQGQAVISAVAAGDIAPADGGAFLGALSQMAKLVETDDLAKRIVALERSRGQ